MKNKTAERFLSENEGNSNELSNKLHYLVRPGQVKLAHVVTTLIFIESLKKKRQKFFKFTIIDTSKTKQFSLIRNSKIGTLGFKQPTEIYNVMYVFSDVNIISKIRSVS